MRMKLNNTKISLNNTRLSLNRWTPADSGFIWWDASDETTIRMQTGVSEMMDKGSYGATMTQSVASQQPEYDIVRQNGLKTITFNNGGGSQFLQSVISSFTLPDFAFAIAFSPHIAGSKYNSIFSYSGDANDFQIDSGDGTVWLGELRTAGYGNHFYETSGDYVTTPQILGFTGDKTNRILTGYKNGVEKFQITDFDGFDTTNDSFYIGANRNVDRFLRCDFYEMAIVPIHEKDQLHEYLMRRWGIV